MSVSCSSPVCVCDFTMAVLRRFVTVPYYDIGIIAVDLYETMNRVEWFRQQGHFSEDEAVFNMALLSRIRNGELEEALWSQQMFRPMTSMENAVPFKHWMRSHGVRVSMTVYDEAVFEEQMAEAAAALEDGHLFWNLYDDDASDSGLITQPPTDSDVSDDEMEPEVIDLTHD